MDGLQGQSVQARHLQAVHMHYTLKNYRSLWHGRHWMDRAHDTGLRKTAHSHTLVVGKVVLMCFTWMWKAVTASILGQHRTAAAEMAVKSTGA